MNTRKTRAIKNFSYIVFSIIITVSVVYLVMHFVVRPYKVDGVSMNPTLNDNDFLLVNRFLYTRQDPERFDLIVFPDQNGQDTEYVKRIIGLPGETIQIMDGTIFINTEELTEYYGYENYIEVMGDIGYPLALDDDEYFVLGDNRNDSIDSRFAAIGPVKRDEIIGRASFRILPLDSVGSLKNQ